MPDADDAVSVKPAAADQSLEPDTGMASRDRVYLAIRAAIIAGDYRPAQRLVEADVAKALGVSKTPVREALYRLEQEELVKSVRNRGFTVRVISQDEMHDLYELRELFEGACARAAASSDNHTAIASELFLLNSQASEALARDDVVEVHRLFSAFDDLIFTQTPNRMLRNQIERMSVLIELSGTVSNFIPGRIRRSLTEHMAILGAIRDGEPDAAEMSTRKHIRSLLADQIAAASSGGPLVRGQTV